MPQKNTNKRQKSTTPVCALTIAGSDSGGGAGIQADLKTFASLGVHGLSVITSVTAQNTRGVAGIFDLPPNFIELQLETVFSDFDVKSAKTGMLSNAPTIRSVRKIVKKRRVKLVVDPVMVSTTGAKLLREDALSELKLLMKGVELITPNIPEAEILSEMKIRTVSDMKNAARSIMKKVGPKSVLIKGGHLKGKEAIDVLLTDRRFVEFKTPKIETKKFHGAGCTFSAAITAELAKGTELVEAVGRAQKFVGNALSSALEVGKGKIHTVNPPAADLKLAEINRTMKEVWDASKLLTSKREFAQLIPEVGTNLAAVPTGASSTEDVVGLSGRIICVSGKPTLTGQPELGGSKHVARATLAAHQLNPQIRAGINIRFSERTLRKLKQMGLTIVSFDRKREPPNAKTMEWGVRQAMKKSKDIPLVVFDEGAVGKEPMIRIFGYSPLEITKIIWQLLDQK